MANEKQQDVQASKNRALLFCSFCHRIESEVSVCIVRGPSRFICDDCVAVACNEVRKARVAK